MRKGLTATTPEGAALLMKGKRNPLRYTAPGSGSGNCTKKPDACADAAAAYSSVHTRRGSAVDEGQTESIEIHRARVWQRQLHEKAGCLRRCRRGIFVGPHQKGQRC